MKWLYHSLVDFHARVRGAAPIYSSTLRSTWYFGRDAVEIFLLGEGGYVDATASALLPALRRLTLRHIVEIAVRGDLVDARRYTERVLGKR